MVRLLVGKPRFNNYISVPGMITIRRIFLFVFVHLVASCATVYEPEILIFDYEDFGPQSQVQDLLGSFWRPWSEDDLTEEDTRNIQIVVYAGMPLGDVKKRYTTDPSKGHVYRYVKYRNAVRYLDKKIEEDVAHNITSRFIDVRKELVAVFE